MRALFSRAKLWLAALLSAAALAAPAQAQQSAKSDHAVATLVFERSAVTPGDSFLGALKLELADGWHVYWSNAGDSGLPPSVTWNPQTGVAFGDFRFPTPHAIPLATLMNYGYEHEVVLPFQIKVSPDAKPGEFIMVGGTFDYLICADICIPEAVNLAVSLPVAASQKTDNDGSAAILSALTQIPVALTGKATVERTATGFRISIADPAVAAAAADAKNIRFFPDGLEILHAAKQVVKTGADGVSIEVTASDFAKPGDQTLTGVVAITAADGSQKGWEFSAAAGPALAGVADKEFVNAEVAGATPPPPPSAGTPPAPPMGLGEIAVMLGFAFIGGMILNLMPCVLPVLTIKAASLVHTAHDPKVSRAHGLAYFGGVLVCFAAVGATLLALRAAGEQAGLGFQLQYPPVTALFALLLFAVGLNLLGVFEIGGSLAGVGGNLADKGGTSGAFFTGLLAAFVGAPCVGPFIAPALGAALSQPAPVVMAVFLMLGVGMAAPFVLLSYTPAFAKILPKPGKWMVTFKQALAFPMFLTVLWLLWVLAAQAGTDGMIVVLAGGIVLAFGIWLANTIGKSLPGKVIAGALILAAFTVPAVMANATKPEAVAVTANAWSPEKVAELRAEGRVIFVDFTARWCVTCQFNKGAIHDGSVEKTFADLNVAFLEADWTNKDSVIAAELAKHGAPGVPLYLVYPASGGDPVKLDQLLSPGMIEKAVREAAGSL